MSILDKLKTTNNDNSNNQLTKAELELLLIIIKESTFKGEHVESLYNLVFKLQQQYLNQ